MHKRIHESLEEITFCVLFLLGIVFFYGVILGHTYSLRFVNWEQTPLYDNYVQHLTKLSLPFILVIVILLGICIPKRIFYEKIIRIISLILVSTLFISIYDLKFALAFLFIVLLTIQLYLIIALIQRKKLFFKKIGFTLQLGSGLLHLGIILFIFDFIILSSRIHLKLFWISLILISLGMIFLFYPDLFRIRNLK
ncbi:MAG: hypothetical protein ACE5K4_01040 [Candidatus Hydrothermarchaeota archaeon]